MTSPTGRSRKGDITFEPLGTSSLPAVRTWFADPDTVEWLGGESWPEMVLGLARSDPNRFAWVAVRSEEMLGLVDVEIYEDGTAGIALVVAPAHRGTRAGQAILREVCSRRELGGTRVLRAGIEPGNVASVGCFLGAGFAPESSAPDGEGFIYFSRHVSPTDDIGDARAPERGAEMDGLDPLATTGWLHENLDREDVRVVDIRGYVRKTDLGDGMQRAEYVGAGDEYDESHIPGAVFVDWTSDIIDPEDPVPAQVAPPGLFSEKMSSLGIGDDTHVVVYDHAGGQFATRLWWALMYYGHEKVSVLNGGWKRWTAEKRPVTGEVPQTGTAEFTAEPRPGWRADAEGVLESSRSGEVLLDARDPGQYTGAVTRGDGRPGHIPAARHLHADTLLDQENGGFVSDAEAGEKLRESGVPEDRDERVTAYCNGGVAATVTLFTLYRLGYRNLANYDGSWNEWGVREDLPTEQAGDDPK